MYFLSIGSIKPLDRTETKRYNIIILQRVIHDSIESNRIYGGMCTLQFPCVENGHTIAGIQQEQGILWKECGKTTQPSLPFGDRHLMDETQGGDTDRVPPLVGAAEPPLHHFRDSPAGPVHVLLVPP